MCSPLAAAWLAVNSTLVKSKCGNLRLSSVFCNSVITACGRGERLSAMADPEIQMTLGARV